MLGVADVGAQQQIGQVRPRGLIVWHQPNGLLEILQRCGHLVQLQLGKGSSIVRFPKCRILLKSLPVVQRRFLKLPSSEQRVALFKITAGAAASCQQQNRSQNNEGHAAREALKTHARSV
jgi:hypothetical protein